MKRKIILYLASTISFSTFSQETKTLNEVIVKGQMKSANEKAEFKRHGQSVGVLSIEEINRNNPAFIEQSLSVMAGIQVDKRTQLGGQRIVIRGYGNDQKFNNWGIKAYYNGVPITTAEGITVLDDIDFSNVNNIEVIKGPAATMYGGGVGGVAHFNMKVAENKGFSISEKISFGSFGLFQNQTKLDFVTDSSSQMLTFGHLQSNGYRPRGTSLKNFLTYFGEFKLNHRNTLSAYASHNFSKENVTGQIPFVDYYAGIDNGNAAYTKKNARNEFLSTRFSIINNFSFSNKLANKTSVFYFNQDFKRVAAGADENSMSPTVGLRSVFEVKTNFSENISNETNLGTEIQQSRSLISNWRFDGKDDANPLKVQDISKGSYFKNITNQNSFFIQNRSNFLKKDLALIIGISANKIFYNRTDLLAGLGLVTGYGKDLSYSKTFATSYNPHIALQKTFKNRIVNISYSEGYNAPTASSSFIGTINKANDALLPEKGKMIDLGLQGQLFGSKLDYQFSLFNIDINNKLTQLTNTLANGGTYTYFANTGLQKNKGIELSLHYLMIGNEKGFISKLEPFLTLSNYNFTYTDFKTKFGANIVDYSGKKIVGVPSLKYTFGLDIETNSGIYMNNAYNSLGDVFTDFANTIKVKGFTQLNSKIGYRKTFKKLDLDIYIAGNNLTNQINYTFLFLGNNINDSDVGSGYTPGVSTDLNPGPSKAYYFGGANLKFRF